MCGAAIFRMRGRAFFAGIQKNRKRSEVGVRRSPQMVRRTPAQLEVFADSESACSRERGRIRRADCLCAISWMRSGRVFVVRGFAQCGDYGEAGEGHVDCRKFWGRTPKTLGFFAIFGFDRSTRQLRRGAKGRGRRGDFSMVRIRLARFALPRFGFSESKSGVFCSPLVCRVRGTIENVRASAARPEAAANDYPSHTPQSF